MPQIQSSDLDRFFQLSSQVHPALAGERYSGDSPCVIAGQDNRDLIVALVESLQAGFPEAGAPYWSARCWTFLVWQPIALSIVGVHGAGVLPPIDALRQKTGPGYGYVAGYQLPDSGWHADSELALIDAGGAVLRQVCDQLLAELRDVIRFKPLSAMRLVADSIVGGLMRLPGLRDGANMDRLQFLVDRWLAAAGLEGQSGLIPVQLDDNVVRLGLSRKGCCMHYRCAADDLCAGCPKFRPAERLQSIREELMEYAGAH
ncbi:MAG: siderophore ferric iron reductase [Alteromonadaceae bacterium]|nr:siderophore ferric iron reductase [Alteromonadaceae bacterium]MBH85104.1 siderophore ferric iron reductase [Alteromonadaceae bacterium]|tara:strand:- start:41500 stop:42276 length:777 start_codon:yes stop_codon:yes gene_type:complete